MGKNENRNEKNVENGSRYPQRDRKSALDCNQWEQGTGRKAQQQQQQQQKPKEDYCCGNCNLSFREKHLLVKHLKTTKCGQRKEGESFLKNVSRKEVYNMEDKVLPPSQPLLMAGSPPHPQEGETPRVMTENPEMIQSDALKSPKPTYAKVAGTNSPKSSDSAVQQPKGSDAAGTSGSEPQKSTAAGSLTFPSMARHALTGKKEEPLRLKIQVVKSTGEAKVVKQCLKPEDTKLRTSIPQQQEGDKQSKQHRCKGINLPKWHPKRKPKQHHNCKSNK